MSEDGNQEERDLSLQRVKDGLRHIREGKADNRTTFFCTSVARRAQQPPPTQKIKYAYENTFPPRSAGWQ